MLMDVIYKKTKSGKIQTWQAEVDGPRYRTHSGQLGGKITTSEWTYTEAKNVGRSNEVSAEEQAKFVVSTLYERRLERDYYSSIDEIHEGNRFFEPMAAHKFQDFESEVRHAINAGIPVFNQPKLDGVRSVSNADGLFSRGGEKFVNCPHIEEGLSAAFEKYAGLMLDGELYNHEFKDDFNSLISQIKKTVVNEETFAASRDVVEYHIYDMPSHPGKFEERYQALVELFESGIFPSNIKLVETRRVESFDDIHANYKDFMENGYEGQMIRINDVYHQDRVSTLLKHKEMTTEEFIVVDIESGKGNWNGFAKKVHFIAQNGKPFKASVKGNKEYAKHILDNKEQFIGKPATVQYQNLTPAGIPRFGVVKEFARSDI